MQDNYNITKGNKIEKFDGSFKNEEKGVTIIPNINFDEINDAAALGVYMYLLSRPKEWNLNPTQLGKHFGYGRDKTHKILLYLMENGYLTKTLVKEKGKFAASHYYVHLHKITNNSLCIQNEDPVTENTVDGNTVDEISVARKPSTANPTTYKTYNITNIIKQTKTKTLVDLKSTEMGSSLNLKDNLPAQEKSKSKSKSKAASYKPSNYYQDELFMRFYNIYPNKQQPRVAYKAFCKYEAAPEFVKMLIEDIKQRMANNWAGRTKDKIPHPSTYLNRAEWEGEIYAGQDNTTSDDEDNTGWKEVQGRVYYNGEWIQ